MLLRRALPQLLAHDTSNLHASSKASQKGNISISSSGHVASCTDSHNSSSSTTDSIHAESTPPLPVEPPSPLHPHMPLQTHSMTTRSQNNIFKPKQIHVTTKHPQPLSYEPSCISQALKDPKWRIAMNEEFTALVRNGTWELVPPNPSQNVVGCKWVFRIIGKPYGNIERFKARLVAKGFH